MPILFKYKKAVQALNYFAVKENGSINKMKAIKLVWLAERLHMRKYGRPIVFDTFFAMKNGPVPSSTKDLAQSDNSFLAPEEIQYKAKYINPSADNYYFSSINAVNLDVFSKSDIAVLDSVYEEFGAKDHFQLSDFSHTMPDWIKYKSILDSGNPRVSMNYDDFFLSETKSNNDISDPDYLKASKELFVENYLF